MGALFDALPESFMKKVLMGEDPEMVESLLENKRRFEQTKDKEEKVRFRERFASAFWDLYRNIGKKISFDTPKEKRVFLRFGILDLRYLSVEDQKQILAHPLEERDPEETVFYVDEWILALAEGRVKPSITDEASPRQKRKSGGTDTNQIRSKYDRAKGMADAEQANYKKLADHRSMLETRLSETVAMVHTHGSDPLLSMGSVYTKDQLKRVESLNEIARELKRIDKDLNQSSANYSKRYAEMIELEKQLPSKGSGGNSESLYEVDASVIESEMGALRQMVKMCVGRQGNHFPVLASGFLPKEVGLKYNFKPDVYERILNVEKMDLDVFNRNFRQQTHHVYPYIILVPGYGNLGMCWEPYDKYNKATSKGRIAVPVFTREPETACLIALADYRWQTAKELASYHWMDEGLTGRYYEYTQEAKLKGDVKQMFITDYLLWVTKEVNGIQKMNKDARYVFWRFVPFPQEVKEELKNKGFYYNELYKKEENFKLSQGY